MTCHGIIRSGRTGESEGKNYSIAKIQRAAPDRMAIKRTEKPVAGFSCLMSGIVHCHQWKALVAPFTPIPCQSRERSELNFTKRTAIQSLDGRRQKKCSASCPSLRGSYRSILGGGKVCFEEEQTVFATSFYHTESLTQVFSYPQGWDLFFFIFSILSLFYGF